MTPEDLERAILAGDAEGVISLFDGVLEADRRKLGDFAVKVKRKIVHQQFNLPIGQYAYANKWYDRHMRQNSAAIAAVLSCSTLSQIESFAADQWHQHDVFSQIDEILNRRLPPWLSEWAEWQLGENELWPLANEHPWLVVRKFIRSGLLERPGYDNYIRSMVSCWAREAYNLSWRSETQNKKKTDPRVFGIDIVRNILENDPDLLDHEVWRVFEVDGIRVQSKDPWKQVFVELCSAGRLDRSRLFHSAISALRRDYHTNQAIFFFELCNDLKPSIDERTTDAALYLELLGSRNPEVVKNGVKVVGQLDKVGKVEPKRVIESLASALEVRPKAVVSAALNLLQRIVERDQSQRAFAATTATVALQHRDVEIQRRVVELLEAHPSNSVEFREALEMRRSGVAASLQLRLSALLPVQPSTEETSAGKSDLESALTALLGRTTLLNTDLLRAAGILDAVRIVRQSDVACPRITLGFHETPRLDPDRRIQPIDSLDELIDCFSALIENEEPVDDIDRVLDGVSRLCADRPSDFERRTSALLARTKALVEKWGNEPLHAGHGPKYELCGLALAWLTGAIYWDGHLEESDSLWRIDLKQFLTGRVLEIASRVAMRTPYELLATPTHSGGWIDPLVAVERFRRFEKIYPPKRGFITVLAAALSAVDAAAHLFDIIQALLRLAPDNREAALKIAGEPRGEAGDALRYALGADDITIGPTAPLWIAAARARSPHQDDERIEHRFPKLGPSAGFVGRTRIEWNTESERYAYRNYRGRIVYEPPIVDRSMVDIPMIAHYGQTDNIIGWEYRTTPDMRYLATIWPQRRHPWWVSTTYSIARMRANEADIAILELLADPDEPMTEEAADLLVVALCAGDAATVIAATDVLIAAIADTRLNGAMLGRAMTNALQIDDLIPQRWARPLSEAARASMLHAVVIREAIERVLASHPDRPPAKMISLMELLVEVSAETGMRVNAAEARSWLEAIKGSGKAARVARLLLAPVTGNRERVARAVAQQVLESRIERAERWQRRTDRT